MGRLAFGLWSFVPVHLRVKDAVTHDAGDRGRLGLEVGLKERLVQLFHNGHERLYAVADVSWSKGEGRLRIRTFFSSERVTLKADSNSAVMLGIRALCRCAKFETTSKTRVSYNPSEPMSVLP